MMKLNTLGPAFGAKKAAKRVGRGIGSGFGKTCGRGHKGQKSRSGGLPRPGFEGGQTPLYRRIPKFGFTNINRKEYVGVNLHKLQELVDNNKIKDTITLDVLVENRLARKKDLVKILGNGELKATLNVTVHKFTATAKAAIENAGGKAETV